MWTSPAFAATQAEFEAKALSSAEAARAQRLRTTIRICWLEPALVLLEGGADPNHADDRGATPLMLAVWCG
jgi:hypothetical protein